MVGDQNVRIRRLAVDKIVNIRSRKCEEQHNIVRKFVVPTVNFKASLYYEMTNLDENDVGMQPLTTNLTNEELQRIVSVTVQFKQPCHSQAVERHI